jgi:hypothetical protein
MWVGYIYLKFVICTRALQQQRQLQAIITSPLVSSFALAEGGGLRLSDAVVSVVVALSQQIIVVCMALLAAPISLYTEPKAQV